MNHIKKLVTYLLKRLLIKWDKLLYFEFDRRLKERK